MIGYANSTTLSIYSCGHPCEYGNAVIGDDSSSESQCEVNESSELGDESAGKEGWPKIQAFQE